MKQVRLEVPWLYVLMKPVKIASNNRTFLKKVPNYDHFSIPPPEYQMLTLFLPQANDMRCFKQQVKLKQNIKENVLWDSHKLLISKIESAVFSLLI